MEKIDLEIRKGSKGQLLDGDFFIKELDADEITDMHESSGKDIDEKALLFQMCIVRANGEPVFKAQQRNLIKKRMKGSHFLSALIAISAVNDFDKMSATIDKYAKNSESDQT